MKIFFRSLILLCVVGLAFAAYRVPQLEVVRKFEKIEPEIDLSQPIVGIGLKPGSGSLEARDEQSGIAELWLDLSQGQKTLQLAHQVFEGGPKSISLPFQLPAAPQGFVNGPASLLLRARDASYWGNQKRVEKTIIVDLVNPRVEIISGSVNTEHGGVGIVFFKVTKESSPKTKEIHLAQLSFPAYPAAELDNAFADKPGVYFGLFAVPFGYDNTKQPVKVVVTNEVGNQGQAMVVTHIKPRKRPRADLKLNKFFLENRVGELMQAYELEQRELSLNKASGSEGNPEGHDGEPLASDRLSGLSGDQLLIARFRLVNESYRKLIGTRIKSTMAKTTPKQLWVGEFIRPIAAKTTSRFAEERFYSYDGLEAGGSYHDGLDLASVSQAPVKAANTGVVLFAGDLGIYGNAIIIDHGFGLSSLYGHLSATSVTEGQAVNKGEQIARSGESGLAGGDHLHFELRLNNLPVTPIEWWDSMWMRDRLDSKKGEVKDFLENK